LTIKGANSYISGIISVSLYLVHYATLAVFGPQPANHTPLYVDVWTLCV